MARPAQGIAEGANTRVSRTPSADSRIHGVPSGSPEECVEPTDSKFKPGESETRAVALCSFPLPAVGRQGLRHFRGDCGTAAGGGHRVCGGAATRAANEVGEPVSKRIGRASCRERG